ncbi:hypothetical protein BN946_scf184908.g158 [Trametes cinnabarina]|uniref:Cytochrome P450 n=1 Tax=Pycnoporus cinnabarinus TaxID=5643 RepID=A0A060SAM9_PYCCI|nr:hypothetical protein BN946_scf184908.g158 [Trametes cinnabarina]
MTRPYFSRERISHFELFDRHAGLAIKKMKERLRGGHAVDFQDVVSRFTLDSATQFLFGKCVQSLEDPLPYAYNDPCAPQLTKAQTVAEQFAEALAEAQRVIATRPRAARVWPLLELLGDKSAGPMRVVDAFLQPIIDEAVAKNRAARAQVKNGAVGSEEAEDHRTLLDHLVKITDDPVVLHDETVNILIAGKDTTAATLTFAIYMMCLNPHVFEQLRAEVLGTVGSQRSPTFDDIRNMKYLRAVINETLRLYAPVPYNFRVANRDTTLPNSDPRGPNVFIPKGTGWLDERLGKYFAVNPSIFAPFNAGPRICLGQQFAYNEMSFFLIRLAQNFSGMELDLAAQPPDARPPPEWAGAEGRKGLEKVVPKCHLTIYVHGGLWVKMIEADRET